MPCENQTSAAQKVKIALQLEQGGRVIGEYSSEDTLDKIYEKAKEKLEGNIPENSVPVIIYVRQELVGIESFSETSLKKLGLTGGEYESGFTRGFNRALKINENFSTVESRFKKDLNFQIHLLTYIGFFSADRFIDLVHESFLNLDLR